MWICVIHYPYEHVNNMHNMCYTCPGEHSYRHRSCGEEPAYSISSWIWLDSSPILVLRGPDLTLGHRKLSTTVACTPVVQLTLLILRLLAVQYVNQTQCFVCFRIPPDISIVVLPLIYFPHDVSFHRLWCSIFFQPGVCACVKTLCNRLTKVLW